VSVWLRLGIWCGCQCPSEGQSASVGTGMGVGVWAWVYGRGRVQMWVRVWAWAYGCGCVGRVGQNHICTVYIYSIFGREITKYTVIYGVYIIYRVLANSMCGCWRE